jgi:hypothetical protein
MLAVIFLMSIVLFVAVDFYLDLSRASNAAAEGTRNARRAVMLLDRVARDLEGAVLLRKPEDLDPMAFPWLFIADADSPEAGADRVKFVRRGRRSSASAVAESDLEMVAWIVADGPDGDLEVRRWSWPQLPLSLERDFPSVDDTDLVAGGIASFGIRFQGDAGAWTGRWDSTTMVDSSELPSAAEIEVAFRTGPNEDDVDGPYIRRVLLPLRPLDLAAQLAAASGEDGGNGLPGDEDADGIPDEVDDVDDDGDDGPGPSANPDGDTADSGDGGGMTVQQCLAAHPEIAALVRAQPGGSEALDSVMDQPARNFAGMFPGMATDCF